MHFNFGIKTAQFSGHREIKNKWLKTPHQEWFRREHKHQVVEEASENKPVAVTVLNHLFSQSGVKRHQTFVKIWLGDMKLV